MASLTDFFASVNAVLWGPPILVLLVLAGIFYMFGLRFLTLRKFALGFRLMFKGSKKAEQTGEGEITPFQALWTVLSGTIGAGNIAGVAIAIALGGPGAVFWMWVVALLGMAVVYAESIIALHFRERRPDGSYAGGAMYYIEKGLGPRWRWLAFAWAAFGILASFGVGSTIQANTAADALNDLLNIPFWFSGIVMTVAAGAVILGGLHRIAEVNAKMIPPLVIFYFAGSIGIMLLHYEKIPGVFASIFHDAFTGAAATGGFVGSSFIITLQTGVARGVFSTEAGLGSAGIAHSTAQTDQPARQGLVAMLGPFIDAIIVCSMTALVILLTGVWTTGEVTGAPLASMAFHTAYPIVGDIVVTATLVTACFSCFLTWAFYGERCIDYLFGAKFVQPYRYIFLCVIFIGTILELPLVWNFADTANGLMFIPNLIALVYLHRIVFRYTKEYFAPGGPAAPTTPRKEVPA